MSIHLPDQLHEASPTPVCPCPRCFSSDIEKFYGDGVYALFYCGDFPAYQELSDINFSEPGTLPIYIGKTSPKTLTGSELNTGAVDAPRVGTRLYDRVARDYPHAR